MKRLDNKFIDNVENEFDNIEIEFIGTVYIDDDTFTDYVIKFEDTPIFKIATSTFTFTSGKVDTDYTLLADIEQDCFQTSNLEEFERNVIAYIKEIV